VNAPYGAYVGGLNRKRGRQKDQRESFLAATNVVGAVPRPTDEELTALGRRSVQLVQAFGSSSRAGGAKRRPKQPRSLGRPDHRGIRRPNPTRMPAKPPRGLLQNGSGAQLHRPPNKKQKPPWKTRSPGNPPSQPNKNAGEAAAWPLTKRLGRPTSSAAEQKTTSQLHRPRRTKNKTTRPVLKVLRPRRSWLTEKTLYIQPPWPIYNSVSERRQALLYWF
jgi:hypothetical protein